MIHSLRLAVMAFIWLMHSAVISQNIVSDLDHDARHRYNRMMVLGGGEVRQLHTSIFPYWRSDLVSLAYQYSTTPLSPSAMHDVQSVLDANNEFVSRGSVSAIEYTDSTKTFFYETRKESDSYRLSRKPLFGVFYKTPAHFYEADVRDFYLRVNPLIEFGGGREWTEKTSTLINRRGIAIRGGIGNNVFFHTSVYDSQIRYPHYINQFTQHYGVVPGAGLYKKYDFPILDVTGGRDYLLATAYAGVDIGKYLGIQLGHQQFFIGDGIRSLFISDFATPYFSLRINTRIWKFHYQNIFSELSADDFNSAAIPAMPVSKKYMAAHYLSFKPSKTITLGLFEAVVFNRPDHRFELQYLNPVILYRTVEGSIGSPDNVLMGLLGKVDVKKRLSFYGQFILDDISIREIFKDNLDWWGNKFGHQLGGHYYNAANIDGLDVQIEWNNVRPYTYSHYDENANYSQYKQALAHPLGANFNEWIFSLRYRASPKLHLQSQLYLIRKGEDGIDSTSFGGDIVVPNTFRPDDYGHTIGQGIENQIMFWSTTGTYEISPGLWADLHYLHRKSRKENDTDHNTSLLQLTVRLNMARREEVF